VGNERVRVVGRHLGALHRAGAIHYKPAHGEGKKGTIGLPELAQDVQVLEARSSTDRAEELAQIVTRTSTGRATYRGFTEVRTPESSSSAAHNAFPHEGDDDRCRACHGTGWVELPDDTVTGCDCRKPRSATGIPFPMTSVTASGTGTCG
jgi:hypothetical protein